MSNRCLSRDRNTGGRAGGMGGRTFLLDADVTHAFCRFPATKKLDDGVVYKCNDKAYLTKDSVKQCDLDQGAPCAMQPAWSLQHARHTGRYNIRDAGRMKKPVRLAILMHLKRTQVGLNKWEWAARGRFATGLAA